MRGRPRKYNRDEICVALDNAIFSCPPPCLPQVARETGVPYDYLKSDLRAHDSLIDSLCGELAQKRRECRLTCSAKNLIRKYGFADKLVVREKIRDDGHIMGVVVRGTTVSPTCQPLDGPLIPTKK